MYKKGSHHSAWVGQHVAKDAKLPLKYSDLVNAVTACPVCSTQCPRQLSKGSGAIHWSSQVVRDWQFDNIHSLLLSKGSKNALVSVDTASGLTQAFLSLHKPGCHH